MPPSGSPNSRTTSLCCLAPRTHLCAPLPPLPECRKRLHPSSLFRLCPFAHTILTLAPPVPCVGSATCTSPAELPLPVSLSMSTSGRSAYTVNPIRATLTEPPPRLQNATPSVRALESTAALTSPPLAIVNGVHRSAFSSKTLWVFIAGKIEYSIGAPRSSES